MKILLTCITALLVLSTVYVGGTAFADITDSNFMINVGDFTPGGTNLVVSGDSTGTINLVLSTILEQLIVVFGVCSVLIMTIGAGYMIIYHGQDEFLSKGKSIFMAGLIALAVALSAGIIMKIFIFILY